MTRAADLVLLLLDPGTGRWAGQAVRKVVPAAQTSVMSAVVASTGAARSSSG